jgi:tetratricopeptide (TPR) repeat protein
MTDALITGLGKISALRVISRTSVMRYKQTKKPTPEIARELNVDAVVEGSVLRSGDRVRITANLVHASTDRQLWTESYERHVRDVLSLQGEVARAIAREVRVEVTTEEEMRLTSVPRVDPEAHEAFLKAENELVGSAGLEAVWRALAYCQEAIRMDAGYAMGYVGLAKSNIMLEELGEIPPKEAHAKAKAAVSKALEIDPMLAEAHAMLGTIQHEFEWDWVESEREYRLAIQLNPNSSSAHTQYAAYLRDMERWQEAFRETERAYELDPRLPGVNTRLWHHFWLVRDYDKAIQIGSKVRALQPKNPIAYGLLGWPYVQKGMHEEAVAAFEKACALAPKDLKLRACLARVYGEAGKETKARKILEEFEERSKTNYVHPYHIALIHIGLREHDRALQWLEKAYEDRSRHMRVLQVDPWLDPLRSDPRFQELVRRMKFPD